MSALIQSQQRPLKRVLSNSSAPKVTSMTIEVFTHVHGNIGGFDMQDGCVACMIATSQLQERTDSDKTLQWLGALISTKVRPAWCGDFMDSLPRDSKVEYLWPSAVNNLTAWTRENNGEVQTIPGGWALQALAPNLKSLRGCIDSLILKAMRVEMQPNSDNFYQSEPGSKILSRNITTNDKTWQAKYNVILAPRGNIDADVQAWIKSLMGTYDFLLFDGGLAACQDAAFGTAYTCAFSTREDAEKAIRARDDVVIARHFAPHRIGSMSPLSVTHTVAGASSPATVPPTPSVSTPGNVAVLSSSAMQKNHNDESPEKRARNDGHVLSQSSTTTTDADDGMKRAQLLVKKCYEEVQELLVLEEKIRLRDVNGQK